MMILSACITGYVFAKTETSKPQSREDVNVAAKPNAKQPLNIVFFHSPSCEDCQAVEKALPDIIKKWDNYVTVKKFNVEDANTFEKLLLYQKHYGVQTSAPPIMFVGDQSLIGENEIIKRLDETILQQMTKGAVTFVPAEPEKQTHSQKKSETSEILNKFKDFSVGAVAAAGLIDGINPCAFTTIIFLLSMLSYLGKSKQQLAVVGIGFTAAVFVTYFLLGLGFWGTIKSFSVSSGISAGITYGVACLTFALAGWSLLDFVRYRRNASVKSVTLGLPQSVKNRIHSVIRKGLKTRSLLIGSISIGFLVSLLESICTGQVYLPVIVFVTRTPELRAKAIGYLLLYNVMFIIPLAIILVITYFGIKSKYLGEFLQGHLGGFKLAMAILFAALGILLLTTV